MNAISQLALKRFFNKCAITRVSNNSYDKLYDFIYQFTLKIVDNSVALKKKTDNKSIILSEDDIQNGMIIEDLLLIVNKKDSDEDYQKVGGLNKELIYNNNIYDTRLDNIKQDNYYNNNNFSIPSKQFQKLVYNILATGNNTHISISKRAIILLQKLVENNVLEYLLFNKNRNNILKNKEFIL
jgi:hypothetical protein